VLIMILFRRLTTYISHNSEKAPPSQEIAKKQTFQQQIGTLFRSRYLLCIALIVLGYNVAINLVEIVWKHQIKLALPDPSDYNSYMGKVMIAMGLIATVTGLFATNNLIRRSSWTFCALIPTVIVGVTGAIFFSYLLYSNGNSSLPLMLAVTLGSFQNCLSRASKYTFFDTTKEMTFIPLDTQTKLNGKVAIDGVGSRLGKSGGSIIHQSLLIVFSSISATTPYIAMIFVAIVVCWGFSVVALGKRFEKQQRVLS
jgi:AAA family ATP:ADP antiporter